MTTKDTLAVIYLLRTMNTQFLNEMKMEQKMKRLLFVLCFIFSCLMILSACEEVDNLDNTEISVREDQQALDGTTNFVDCTDSQRAKIQDALTYATNRSVDGELFMGECLRRAYMLHDDKSNVKESEDGRTIADTLTWSYNSSSPNANFEKITCKDAGHDYFGMTYLNLTGERLTVNIHDDVFNPLTKDFLAGVIVHEVLHNRDYSEWSNSGEAAYYNSVSKQAEYCVRDWTPTTSTLAHKGYALYFDGTLAGNETGWTLAQAKTNCQSNKTKYPAKVVECYYNGAKFGYELYWNGVRVGFEPSWSLSQGKTNCQLNKVNNPTKHPECRYNNTALGYELYWDGVRVGFEPSWTLAQGKTNCQSNKTSYGATKKVECYFNGNHVGYELFRDGRRVGYEPQWTLAQAKTNCQSNRSNASAGTLVECRFDGTNL